MMPRTRALTSATFSFDYPTVNAIAEFMLETLAPKPTDDRASVDAPLDERELRERLAEIPLATLRESGLLDKLLRLAERQPASVEPSPTTVDEMSVDDLINFVLPDPN